MIRLRVVVSSSSLEDYGSVRCGCEIVCVGLTSIERNIRLLREEVLTNRESIAFIVFAFRRLNSCGDYKDVSLLIDVASRSDVRSR